jgi:hypothetical protein
MPVLTLAQLQAATIQADVAKEAYAQVEKRLSDLLEVKKSFETRAASMLSAFITLTLALTGAGASFYTSGPLSSGPKDLAWAFFWSAFPLFGAAILMFAALYPTQAGTLGTAPEMWLEAGKIDGPAAVVPVMQAYMVYYMHERIEATVQSNTYKMYLIVGGAGLAGIAPVVLGALLWYFSPP